jgi:lysophospholipase L1-like esterase
MLFAAQQRIVFIGDSITDCGRRAAAAPYGNGYVSMVRNLITARYAELGLTFLNRGVGGNTVRDLAARWEQDVIAERPDWLAVKIGINDCWRSFVAGRSAEAVLLPEYEATLRRLLDRTRSATTARLILMQPYMIEPDKSRPMRRAMDSYSAIVDRLAAEYGAVLVPTQAAWDAALARTRPTDWAEDQIHPTAAGHAVIALAFLRAVGFSLEMQPKSSRFSA